MSIIIFIVVFLVNCLLWVGATQSTIPLFEHLGWNVERTSPGWLFFQIGLPVIIAFINTIWIFFVNARGIRALVASIARFPGQITRSIRLFLGVVFTTRVPLALMPVFVIPPLLLMYFLMSFNSDIRKSITSRQTIIMTTQVAAATETAEALTTASAVAVAGTATARAAATETAAALADMPVTETATALTLTETAQILAMTRTASADKTATALAVTPMATPVKPTPEYIAENQVLYLDVQQHARGFARGQWVGERMEPVSLLRRYENLTINDLEIMDPWYQQKLRFRFSDNHQSLISTESEIQPTQPLMVTFEVPTNQQVPASHIWLIMNASSTDKGRDKSGDAIAAVRISFNHAGSSYEREFLLYPGHHIADWVVDGNSVDLLTESNMRDSIRPVLIPTDGYGRVDNQRVPAQLLVIGIPVDTGDPVTAISIEDRSLFSSGRKNPALDVAAVALVKASGLDEAGEVTLTPTPTPTHTSEQTVFAPLCLVNDMNVELFNANKVPLRSIIQDNDHFTPNCSTSEQITGSVDFVLPIGGDAFGTWPDRAAPRQDPQTVISSIRIEPGSEAETAIENVHLLLSVHNLCIDADYYDKQIGRIVIRFTDGYKLPDIPLIAGRTIRQNNTSPLERCGEDQVLRFRDQTMMLSQYGMEFDATRRVESGEWFERFDAQNSTMNIDHFRVPIPEVLRDREIESIEIIDEFTDRLNNSFDNDPFLFVYSVTLEHGVSVDDVDDVDRYESENQ